MRKPQVKNKEYINIHIESLNSEGQGVGRVNGYVVFVVGALPGETCKAQVFKVTQKYAVARLIKFAASSKLRTNPPCPYFGKCGGCSLQHIKYPAQLLFKQRKVIDALAKIGGIKKDIVSPTIGMEKPWHYRNKSIFSAQNDVENTIIGMYQPHSHKTIDIDGCLIADKKINAALLASKDWIRRAKVMAYDEKSGRGDLRSLFFRVAKNTGQVMAGAITAYDALPGSDTFTALLRHTDNDIVSIFQNINSRTGSERMSSDTKFLWGTKTITDNLGKLQFEISPYSFYQINPVQTKKLYDTILNFSGLNGKGTVLDAYCGVGTIGQYLASHCEEVIGIETSSQAISDAKENSRLNHIRNTDYLAGSCNDILPQLLEAGKSFDVIIVDPPRSGCESGMVDALVSSHAPKVIYVSCNPATMARDIKQLRSSGYSIDKVQPFDMFPQTDHVECVVLMTRQNH